MYSRKTLALRGRDDVDRWAYLQPVHGHCSSLPDFSIKAVCLPNNGFNPVSAQGSAVKKQREAKEGRTIRSILPGIGPFCPYWLR